MLRYTGSPTSSVDFHDTFADKAQDFSDSFQSAVLARSCPKAPSTTGNGTELLAAKLSKFVALNVSEVSALHSLFGNVRDVATDQTFVHEGHTTDHISLLVEGFACRYKLLPGGRRQILGYLIPGDMCDAHYVVFNRPDHSLAALSNSKVARIPIDKVADMLAIYPRVATAIACSELVEGAILREWLLNVGQRHGEQRLAHLICEIGARLKLVGRVASDGSFDFPVSQATLADTVGLTLVHTNRILKRLRHAGLICLRHRRVAILDVPRLVALAGFDENYLHLRGHEV